MFFKSCTWRFFCLLIKLKISSPGLGASYTELPAVCWQCISHNGMTQDRAWGRANPQASSQEPSIWGPVRKRRGHRASWMETQQMVGWVLSSKKKGRPTNKQVSVRMRSLFLLPVDRGEVDTASQRARLHSYTKVLKSVAKERVFGRRLGSWVWRLHLVSMTAPQRASAAVACIHSGRPPTEINTRSKHCYYLPFTEEEQSTERWVTLPRPHF